MGTVTASASVLEVGRPDHDPAGRLQGWMGSPRFMVGFTAHGDPSTAGAWERLALAVFRASRRFLNVDELGNVVPDEELGLTGTYTPNWVSEPILSARGVCMVVDTGSYLSLQMGAAMLRVLVEELGRLPFDTRVSDEEPDSPEERWRPPDTKPVGEKNDIGKPLTVVIERAVRCVLRDGVPGVTPEYLDARGGWTASLADARVFGLGENGTHWETYRLALSLAAAMGEEL